LRGRRNLDQIQIFLAGFLKRFVGRHNAQLRSFIVDHANFARANAVIGADKTFVDTVLRALCN
jgi:hypothetical protein